MDKYKLPWFLCSCLLAFLAGHLINYSIIFLFLEWFDSSALAGIGYGLCFGPPLILGWFAGVYCDRYSPRKVILIAQNSFFISLFLIYSAFSAETELGQKFFLLTAALFSGIGWSFVAPARFAALPFYVSKAKLMTASIALNLMVMTGFGLAPMLLKLIKVNYSWHAVLATSASLFILSSAILLPLTLTFAFKGKSSEKAFNEIKESLQYVKQSHFIKQFLLLATIAYLLMGPMQVILPTIADKTLLLSEENQGKYLSLVAFSLIAGGLFAMWSKTKGSIGLQLMLAIMFAGLGIGYLGIESNVIISMIVLVISAACGGVAISLIVAGLQRYSPEEHRGRIMSFYTIIGQAVPAASGVGAGILAQTYSPATALAVIAALMHNNLSFDHQITSASITS
jgi:MFS family permease